LTIVRQHAAEFIKKRDGFEVDPDEIFLSSASLGIKVLTEILSINENGKRSGYMISIPQYPLYSATIAEFDGEMV
jgi:alanine transaminase